MMYIEKWRRLENLFEELLNLSAEFLSSEEIQEVREFVDANEFGIAMDTYKDIVGGRSLGADVDAIVREIINEFGNHTL